MADGDVSLYNAAGSAAKFFWGSSTERLGIVTTTPSARGQLHLHNSTNKIYRREFNSLLQHQTYQNMQKLA